MYLAYVSNSLGNTLDVGSLLNSIQVLITVERILDMVICRHITCVYLYAVQASRMQVGVSSMVRSFIQICMKRHVGSNRLQNFIL
jgi:hypothetical protein